MSTDQPYVYFMAYNHGRGVGSIEISSSHEYTTYEQIKDATVIIANQIGTPLSQVVVTNWILLRIDDTATT